MVLDPALASGSRIAYGVRAFTAAPLMGNLLGMRISNAAFLAGAIWLIWFAVRRVRRFETLNYAVAEPDQREKLSAI